MGTGGWSLCYVKTSNNLLHFGRAWGKILHNKSFWFVFQEKTPPISILKLALKTGRIEAVEEEGEEPPFSRENNNVSSICHT